jgi:hypothetical protein
MTGSSSHPQHITPPVIGCYKGDVAQQAVAMLMLHGRTPRDEEARAQLSAALPDASIGRPDEQGIFEIAVDAEDQEDALTRVWNAVAASATDDHIVFLEHPELPEHWRHRASRPTA